MTKKHIFITVAIALIPFIVSFFILHTFTKGINERLMKTERGIAEIANLLVQSGTVIVEPEGKYYPNTLLLEAWKQTQTAP